MRAWTEKDLLTTRRRRRRLLAGLGTVAALTLLADFVVHRHADHPWETIVDFYGIYTAAAVVVLVLAARALRLILGRREAYYDE